MQQGDFGPRREHGAAADSPQQGVRVEGEAPGGAGDAVRRGHPQRFVDRVAPAAEVGVQEAPEAARAVRTAGTGARNAVELRSAARHRHRGLKRLPECRGVEVDLAGELAEDGVGRAAGCGRGSGGLSVGTAE